MAAGPTPAPVARAADPWWRGAVIYQVYPRSFADADGDGTGDLAGMIAHLDHLAWLGVDAVWLSPVFRSPMRDGGYDVADHTDIDPVFGSLADMDRLLEAAHGRGIRVLLDFVPNHCSSDHPWFQDARASRASPRRDWFIWRDPAPGGGPPNALRSAFGGSAWTFDEATGQYWFHTFLPEQPDLDWRNPDVRAAMHGVLRFWFARGVDGVRIDVVWLIAKDGAPWADDPVAGDPAAIAHGDGPAIARRLEELREVADAFPGRVLLGETYLPPEQVVRYYGEGGRGLHLPFNFGLVMVAWEAAAIRDWIRRYEAALGPGDEPDWVLGNHDQPRIATRSGGRARAAALLLLTLRGVAVVYQGDELGLEDGAVPPGAVVDVAGRDPQRTPMPWDGGPQAGFTRGTPWLPLGADARTRHAAAQREDPHSVLALHRALVALRRAEPALAAGAYRELPAPDGVIAFERRTGNRRLAVVLNLGTDDAAAPLPDGRWRVLLATGLDRDGTGAGPSVRLAPGEGLVLEPIA